MKIEDTDMPVSVLDGLDESLRAKIENEQDLTPADVDKIKAVCKSNLETVAELVRDGQDTEYHHSEAEETKAFLSSL